MTIKNVKIALMVIFSFAFIIFVFNLYGLLYLMNNIFPQNPDISCKADSDCKLHAHPEWSQCKLCPSCKNFDVSNEEVIAINKNWKPFCPFRKPTSSYCLQCIGGISGTAVIKCVENRCLKILN